MTLCGDTCADFFFQPVGHIIKDALCRRQFVPATASNNIVWLIRKNDKIYRAYLKLLVVKEAILFNIAQPWLRCLAGLVSIRSLETCNDNQDQATDLCNHTGTNNFGCRFHLAPSSALKPKFDHHVNQNNISIEIIVYHLSRWMHLGPLDENFNMEMFTLWCTDYVRVVIDDFIFTLDADKWISIGVASKWLCNNPQEA